MAEPRQIEFPVAGSLVDCTVCGRKILVERALIGTDHTMRIFTTCVECMDPGTKLSVEKRYGLKLNK